MILSRHAGGDREVEGAPEKRHDPLHRRARGFGKTRLVVHQDDAAVVLRGDLRQLRMSLESVHVVDDVRPGLHGGAGDRGLIVGVNGKGNLQPAGESFDHRHHAGDFFLDRHLNMPGPGGLTADVDDRRAFGRHLRRLTKGGFQCLMSATIEERVRGDVQDAHDFRPAVQGQGLVPKPNRPRHRVRGDRGGERWEHRGVLLQAYRPVKAEHGRGNSTRQFAQNPRCEGTPPAHVL